MRNNEEISFRAIWGATHLFFSLSSLDWYMTISRGPLDTASISKVLVPVFALFVLLRPQSSILLLGMALSQLTEAFCTLPEIPNHRHVVSFLNLAVCARILVPSSQVGSFEFIRSVGTRLAIIVYFFATFAKLNSGFLDPGISCAASFYGHVKSIFQIAPSGASLDTVLIYGTILVEGFFVIGLMVPRLRGFTVFLGALFHAALALDLFKHFVDFTAVMISLLWLFKEIRFLEARERQVLALAFLVVMALGVLCLAELSLYLLYSAFLYILFAMWVLPLFSRNLIIVERLPVLHITGALILALSVLSGLGPYIGLKTRGSLTMYSNLLIDEKSSNHLIVPRSVDIFGFMSDSVELVRASRFPLEGHSESGVRIPRVELSRQAAKDSKFTATFRDKAGFEQDISDSFRSEALMLPWWIKKFVIFRPEGAPVRDQCVW